MNIIVFNTLSLFLSLKYKSLVQYLHSFKLVLFEYFFYFFYSFIYLSLYMISSSVSSLISCMGVQLRWQSIRFACEGQRDRCPPPPLFSQIYGYFKVSLLFFFVCQVFIYLSISFLLYKIWLTLLSLFSYYLFIYSFISYFLCQLN